MAKRRVVRSVKTSVRFGVREWGVVREVAAQLGWTESRALNWIVLAFERMAAGELEPSLVRSELGISAKALAAVAKVAHVEAAVRVAQRSVARLVAPPSTMPEVVG